MRAVYIGIVSLLALAALAIGQESPLPIPPLSESSGEEQLSVLTEEAKPELERPTVWGEPTEVRIMVYMIDLDVTELLFIKTDDWSYEREQRMVRLLRDVVAAGTQDQEGHAVYVIELPPPCIEGVVFGHRTSGDDRAQFGQVLEDACYSHVKRFEVQLDEISSTLKVIPI